MNARSDRPFSRFICNATLMAALMACRAAPAQTHGGEADAPAGVDLLRVYDLRDLRAIIPAPESEDDGLTSATERLIGELTNAMGSSSIAIADDVYAVSASAEKHAQLAALLTSVRDLYKERYELTLLTYFVLTHSTVQIGDVAKPDSISARRSFVATRRTPFRAGTETRHTYVSGVMPIVAEQAVGYQPMVRTTESGLRLNGLVGAGPEDSKGTSLMLSGEWSMVSPGRTFSVESTGGSPAYRLEFPQVETQLFRSDVQIEFGKLTVVAILGSPREGESMILAASVRKLP